MATPYDFDGYEDYDSTGLLREHTRIHGTPTIGTTGARNSGQAPPREGGGWRTSG